MISETVMAATFRLPFDSRFRMAAVALAAIPCLATLFVFNPAEPGLFPPCPFRALTGFHCPGCGTLRGLHQMLNGHFLGALAFNPLMVISLPFIGYALMSNAVFTARGRSLPGFRLPATGIWLLLGAIILFWILRNIPAHPFSALAP